MARVRNILLVIALVGFTMPTPMSALAAGPAALQSVPAKGCCGRACACAATGGCECRSRPRTPAPQPPQHQAADPVGQFQKSASALLAVHHPAAHVAPAALSVSSPAVLANDPDGAPPSGRRLALLGALLI